MINLEETVVRKLKTVQHILCSVESCTGGLISSSITNVSGSSEVFWGSWVVYDNSAKENLGISAQIIGKYGAVSKETARELAEKGLQKLESIYHSTGSFSLLKPKGFVCIATTGIAGPGGGTKEKPVGLCYIGLAVSGKATVVEEFHAKSDSDRVQKKSEFAQKALEMIRTHF